jgi:hypothetical protein
MDDAWNLYIEKKQQACYDLMLYTFMIAASTVLIGVGLTMNVEDHLSRVIRDITVSIGMVFAYSCITQHQWIPENRHNHQLSQ